MSAVTARPVRLRCDLASPNLVRDDRTGQMPVATRGAALHVEVGLYINNAILDDKTNYESATLKLRGYTQATGAIGDVQVAVALTAAGLADCTGAAWLAGTGQHARFALTSAELNLAAGDYWIVIVGQTNAGETIVWCAGRLRIVDHGVTDETAGTPEFLPSNGPTCKRGTVDVVMADETVAIAFTTAFVSAPTTVIPSLIAPANGDGVSIWVDGAPTTAGFTVRFGAPIPAAGYTINWLAVL